MKTYIISAVLLSASVGYSFGTAAPSPDSMAESYYSGGFNSNISYSTSSSCASIPDDVKTAYAQAKAFTKGCSTAQLAPGKKIAINDYSPGGEARMFVFDQDGNCLDSMPISWGSGAGGQKEACSTNNSEMTPPGFHITAPHIGGSRYNQSNSIGLAGLSGQDSLAGRGILIHGVTYQTNRGNTWGCTGVPMDQFYNLKSVLGYGSLVYNYFGSGGDNRCSSSAGFAPPSCQPEARAVQASNAYNKGGYSYAPSSSPRGSTIRGKSGAGSNTGSGDSTVRGGSQ